MDCLLRDEFYLIDELQFDWNTEFTKIRRWLVAGRLKTHLWLPVMSVYRQKMSTSQATELAHELTHYEGFIPVSASQCQRLFRSGQLTIRKFTSPCGQESFELPDTTDDILVTAQDLIVLSDERERFEIQQDLISNDNSHQVSRIDFQSIAINGTIHTFGDMQAKVMKALYEAALTDKPWRSGKRLLHEAGSESLTLGNFFKQKPIWKELIISNKKGGYRLHEKWVGNWKSC